MTDKQLLAIVVASLFKVLDTNPPHGRYETQHEAMKRTIVEAKQLIYAVEQS